MRTLWPTKSLRNSINICHVVMQCLLRSCLLLHLSTHHYFIFTLLTFVLVSSTFQHFSWWSRSNADGVLNLPFNLLVTCVKWNLLTSMSFALHNCLALTPLTFALVFSTFSTGHVRVCVDFWHLLLVRIFMCHAWAYSLLCLQITRLDIRPHLKLVVSLMIADGHLIYPRVLCENVWVNTLTLSSLSVFSC